MSEQPEARGGGGMLTRKGPMGISMWVWIVLVVVAVGGAFMLYRSKSKSTATGSSTDTTGSSPSSTPSRGGSTSAADVPQFVNQSYTTVSAPSSTTINEPPPPPDHDQHHEGNHEPDHPRKTGHRILNPNFDGGQDEPKYIWVDDGGGQSWTGGRGWGGHHDGGQDRDDGMSSSRHGGRHGGH